MRIHALLKGLGHDTVASEYYDRIAQWRRWYAGKVPRFHDYSVFNGTSHIKRERARMNMAKQGCEYWADLLWNAECAVNLKNSEDDKLVNAVLRMNDFTRRFNIAIERAFALGTGACVVYPKGDDVKIGLPMGDMVFPLAWDDDEVVSCAFAAIDSLEGEQALYLETHERQVDMTYLITNRYFKLTQGGEIGTERALPDGIQPQTRSATRRFAIIRPNIANNIMEIPMGIAVYANCIDTLKAIDLAYDGAKTSMEIGRPRIGVSTNTIKIDKQTGAAVQYFDANDVSVYDLGAPTDTNSVEVKDLSVEYRAADFENSLQRQLQVYARAIGLGENTFKWDRSGGDVPKTATEVLANNATTLRAMEKHQAGLRSTIDAVIRAILEIKGRDTTQVVGVVFDDSVARDRGREALEAWQWVVAGKYPFWKYLIDFKGYDEEEAKAIEAAVCPSKNDFNEHKSVFFAKYAL